MILLVKLTSASWSKYSLLLIVIESLEVLEQCNSWCCSLEASAMIGMSYKIVWLVAWVSISELISFEKFEKDSWRLGLIVSLSIIFYYPSWQEFSWRVSSSESSNPDCSFLLVCLFWCLDSCAFCLNFLGHCLH